MTRCTQEQLDFLECGFKLWRRPLLTLFFNAWFGLDKTEIQIHSVISNHRFTCGRKGGFEKGQQLTYSQEQIEWLKEAYKKWTPKEMAPRFNDRFRTNKTWRQLRSLVKNQGIVSGRDRCFPKGNRPWNYGTAGKGDL